MLENQNTEQTEQFFSQWSLYQRVIAENYMAHREISAALKAFLAQLPVERLAILDLGCGDATMAADVLTGLAVSRYCGVDLAEPALQLARDKLAGLDVKSELINQDLSRAIVDFKQEFNVIFAGFSVHHLLDPDKLKLFHHCAGALQAGGHLLIYDLVRLVDESREQCLQRHWRHYRQWRFPQADLDNIRDHIFEQDYAQSPESLKAMAEAAGFETMRTLFVDPDRLYAVYGLSL